MEFLVFLLLGFAAVLLVVPSIIRSRLEESPVATADYFQKSMSELGRSLHIDDPRRDSVRANASRDRSFPVAKTARLYGKDIPKGYYGHPNGSRNPRRMSKAEIRRNRIMAVLLTNSLIWGLAALFTTRLWALILFTVTSVLFALYWLAALSLTGKTSTREPQQMVDYQDTSEDERGIRAHLP